MTPKKTPLKTHWLETGFGPIFSQANMFRMINATFLAYAIF